MRCLALFTGGLDSQIAVRMMQRQAIEVIGVHIRTPFTPPANDARVAAERVGIELREIEWLTDYLNLLRRPLFGFAQEMAPCLDCRIGMLQRAQQQLESLAASFLISGEVVGQRPSSLRSRDLESIAVHGGVDDLLLRPLSAQLLPPTLPERNGWVDRTQLHGWHGRGRREQLLLAREWNLVSEREQQNSCLLLEPTYAGRLRFLLKQSSNPPLWHLATLKFGRHFGLENRAHIVVAKNADEGRELTTLFDANVATANVALLQPLNFRGPLALLIGNIDDGTLQAAATLVARYGKDVLPEESTISVRGTVDRHVTVPCAQPDQVVAPWH
ncbi:hypothetical protein ETAA8_29950 [Anatilimnocola aggregata]|uniref:Uncharacterized protein n=1 Tax=Anatilimnocola aggregata TaxID=2528021 RepID=A0A517YCE8_9BACT|nr:tRNA 4-thiouridine(8) synthase ThiI [Anatilimnocola aggregata]QDU27904.1 hypothetical protein ETAA8_29950 [Anatilimnocola aggregata]